MSERALKILYVAGLSPNDSSQYRAWALERLGHTVVPLNFYPYESKKAVVRKVVHRLHVGPAVARFNRDIVALAKRERPDVFWADKLLWLWPSTIDKLRAMGIATVSYMIDNPFGTRRDPGWRLYMKDIPHFDLHVVQRDKNIADYKDRGARDVIKIQTAYEPTLHFPPPHGWSDKDRDRDVSFIGTPYDERGEFLTTLWKQFGLRCHDLRRDTLGGRVAARRAEGVVSAAWRALRCGVSRRDLAVEDQLEFLNALERR